MVVWTEGRWLQANDQIVWTGNSPTVVYHQDPFSPNSRIMGQRVTADTTTLAVAKVGAALEVSRGANGTADNPTGTDPTAIHPSVYPDVTWDGANYLFVWETMEDEQTGATSPTGGQFDLRHQFRTSSRARFRTFSATGVATSGLTNLSDKKPRFLIKGPPTNLSNIVDGSLPDNLLNERINSSVPTDPQPRIDSLILPGPDGRPGTADDVAVGSLVVWAVTTLVFNEPKSRIRGRFIPHASTEAGIVWDIFSPPAQVVQRATVAAGATNDLDNPNTPENENRDLSHFLVNFLSVDNVIGEGPDWKVEFTGSINGRMTEENGIPSGPVFEVAKPDASQTFLSPTVSWCAETDQYFVAWTRSDTDLWNPTTQGRTWHPKSWALLDVPVNPPPGPQLAGIASLYPVGAAASYSAMISPTSPYQSQQHLLYVGQENDFVANFFGWYRFPNPGAWYGSPKIGVSQGLLRFGTPDQETAPPSQEISLRNSSGQTSILNWQAESDQGWLRVDPTRGQLPMGEKTTMTFSVDPKGLPTGTYKGKVKITSPTATNSPQSVDVQLEVGVPLTGGSVEEDSGGGGGGGGGCGGQAAQKMGPSGVATLMLLALALGCVALRRRRLT